MAETIHTSTHDINDGPTWHIERQPQGTTDPGLVSFVKQSRHGKLLDQVARWGPDGWDTKRWVPRPPQAPKWLLQKVEGHMQRCIDA